jgi:hypothetical protein
MTYDEPQADAEATSGVRIARERAKRAKEQWETWLQAHPTSAATESAPTYSDCAALHYQAAVAYGTASALGAMGQRAQAAGWAAQGATLAAAGESCDVAAGGGTIEL